MVMADGMVWWLAASVAVNLICLTALAGVWLWSVRQAQTLKQQNKLLEQKIGVATSGAIGMGHRIVALEQKLQRLQEKQEHLSSGDVFTYSQALQMFEQGADASTVASNCGLSSSEAQLMALVQQQMRKSTSKPAKGGAKKTSAESTQ